MTKTAAPTQSESLHNHGNLTTSFSIISLILDYQPFITGKQIIKNLLFSEKWCV